MGGESITGKSIKSTKTQAKQTPRYMGPLQHCHSRVPAIPEVNYAKGGSDFRCIEKLSSFGTQAVKKTSGKAVMGSAERFPKRHIETIGPGPASLGQYSSMKDQMVSSRPSTQSMSFGTSTRDDALLTYTVSTYKRY